jgi:hypothetical protein
MIIRDLSLLTITANKEANFYLDYKWKNLKHMPNIDPVHTFVKN